MSVTTFTDTASPDNDIVVGTTLSDTIDLSGGDNWAFGGLWNDSIKAGNGNDTIYGGSGDDTIDGGGGANTLYGGTGADSLVGGSSTDQIYGGSGNDTIIANSDADVIVGGFGADMLTGGNGADTFRFLSTLDTGDTIFGFVSTLAGGGTINMDKFDFSAIDAIPGGGDNAFLWGGSVAGPTVVANSITWYTTGGNTIILADTDGNVGTAEFMVTLTGVTAISSLDFTL